MMQIVWFCAAGYSFFVGILLILSAIILSLFFKKAILKLTSFCLIIISILLILLSATPFSLWFYVIWGISLAALLLVILVKKLSFKFQVTVYAVAGLLSLTAAFTELPFQFKPAMPNLKFKEFYIIGDSVSAGIRGKNEMTWPKLLSQKQGIEVINLAQAGATAASGIKQAEQIQSEEALILVEIGGNDLFEPTPLKTFEQDLEQILKILNNSKRTILMMELPLQPWQIGFGKIQRELAKKYSVILIPKRYFVSVLSTDGATTDLAHLSAFGHELMAEIIRQLIGDLFNRD